MSDNLDRAIAFLERYSDDDEKVNAVVALRARITELQSRCDRAEAFAKRAGLWFIRWSNEDADMQEGVAIGDEGDAIIADFPDFCQPAEPEPLRYTVHKTENEMFDVYDGSPEFPQRRFVGSFMGEDEAQAIADYFNARSAAEGGE